MLRTVRIICATLTLVLLTLFFLGILESYFGSLAKLQLIPSLLAANLLSLLALGIITLLFGRIYCSALCPLGIIQDVFLWFSCKASRKKQRFTYNAAWTRLRYAVLTVATLAFVAGVPFVMAILDPYSIYGRMVTHLLSPVWLSANNLFAPQPDKYKLYLMTKQPVYLQSLGALLISVLSLSVIAFMAWKYGRLYCNTICPAGTMLGTLSRYSLYKITVDTNKCNHCGLCASNCKSACIDSKNQQIDYSRCVACFDCIKNCRQQALTYAVSLPQQHTKKNTGLSAKAVSRRQFLAMSAITLGSAIAFITKTSAYHLAALSGERTPVLPPGSKSVSHLGIHCTSCHLCVSKCPNQVLQPMILGYGLGSFMQPAMDFKKGYCDYDCNLCGNVCPNQAIERQSLEEKQKIKIGYAVFNQSRCLAETDNINCGNCAAHCPTQAITMVPNKGKEMPVINLSKCIGCGSCEYHCSANPKAIYVLGLTEQK